MSYDPRQFDTYVLSCVVHRALCAQQRQVSGCRRRAERILSRTAKQAPHVQAAAGRRVEPPPPLPIWRR
jgi:hypothetical protein